jgi:hypothetical protein
LTENNQEKPEISGKKRGRPRNAIESVQVSWRIPADIYQLLEKEKARIDKATFSDIPLSKVLQGIVKKQLK